MQFQSESQQDIFFSWNLASYSKIHVKEQRVKLHKIFLQKKARLEDLPYLLPILYFKAMGIKSVWYIVRANEIDQGNMEHQNRPTCVLKLIYHKDSTIEQQEKARLFNKWCQDNCLSMWKKRKMDLYHTPQMKINSQRIKNKGEK